MPQLKPSGFTGIILASSLRDGAVHMDSSIGLHLQGRHWAVHITLGKVLQSLKKWGILSSSCSVYLLLCSVVYTKRHLKLQQ